MIGLVAGTIALGLLVLPFWSFIKVMRLEREVEQLRARLGALETRRESTRPFRRDRSGALPRRWIRCPRTVSPPPPIALPSPPPPFHSRHHRRRSRSRHRPSAVRRRRLARSVEAPAPAAAAADVAAPDDLESRVGGRWLLYTGIAILLIGVSFFLKYAFDNAWIDERGRVGFGVVVGFALIVTGWRMARQLPAFGLALTGTGLATLYLASTPHWRSMA